MIILPKWWCVLLTMNPLNGFYTDDQKHQCLYFLFLAFLFHKGFTWYLHFIPLSSYLQKWSNNNARAGKSGGFFFSPGDLSKDVPLLVRGMLLKKRSALVWRDRALHVRIAIAALLFGRRLCCCGRLSWCQWPAERLSVRRVFLGRVAVQNYSFTSVVYIMICKWDQMEVALCGTVLHDA